MKKKIILGVLMLFAAVGVVHAADTPPFQEEGAMWRMWDEVPPEYSDKACYYINGEPGGEGFTHRKTLDYVNFGDLESESGHEIEGWSDVWTWGGNYGGGDDGTLRTIIPRVSSCTIDDKLAYFSMFSSDSADYLRLRHLLGSQNDSYRLYVYNNDSWVELDVQSSVDKACVGGECWYTDGYDLSGLSNKASEHKFMIEATLDPIPTWCSSWGINAFSWAELSQVEY